MVRVSGSLRLVTDRAALVSQVRVRAARDRAERGGLTTTFDDVVPVKNGRVEMNVLPGPAVMVLEESGGFSHVVELLVPDGDASLEECVRAAGDADEYSRRELEQMVWEVREAYPQFQAVADRTVEAASRAAGSASSAASSAGAAKNSERTAQTYAANAKLSESSASASASRAGVSESNAGKSATAAAGSATSAKQSADTAGVSERNAKQSETSAAGSATAAGVSAGNAKTSETNAGKAASAAGTSETNAGKAARDAQSSATAAATSETNSAEHASKAARHEVAAQGHAGDAATSAESAKADAERVATIAGSTRWVGTQVEVNGKLSESLMPVLEVSSRGTWVINGTDTGQAARGPGGASSWSDISGKPAVFPPSEHKHTSSQVTDAVNDAGDPKFGGKLVKGRDSDGKIFYYKAPTEGRELSNKDYVDQQVGVLRAEVLVRPAFFSGPGNAPASIPGARVGDYWLNETTMELHKITGV